MTKKKRGSVLEQVEEGRRIAWGAYKRKVKGFTVGMRVEHDNYGKGVIVVVDDRETSLQRYWMNLDMPVSLGGGERLNGVWVWPGHLTKEEIVKDEKEEIKSKLKKEKIINEKPKRKRRARKKK